MKKYVTVVGIITTFILSTIILSPPKPLRTWGGIALADFTVNKPMYEAFQGVIW